VRPNPDGSPWRCRDLVVGILLIVALAVPGCRRRDEAAPVTPDPARPARPDPPGPEALPAVRELPDPFLFKGGQRVRTAAEWPRRRAELKELVQAYAYGHLPPSPGKAEVQELQRETVYGGKATRRLVRLTLGPAKLQLILGLIAPTAEGQHPAIVHVDHRMTFGVSLAEELVGRGYVVVGYDPRYLAPDEPGVVGPAQAAYPEHDWATLAVWAWGAMRAADYLLTLPEVDGKRLAVTGHSRSGKAALLAGALDERFALVAPQGSGCAGAASYRFREGAVETLADITRNFPHWFTPGLKRFVGKEERLPLDQHLLLALVAPRALLSIDALGDLWANPLGTEAAHLGAKPVFALLGAADRIGVSFRPGVHELHDDDWRTFLAFAEQVFFGRAPDGRRFDQLPLPLKERTHSWSAPR